MTEPDVVERLKLARLNGLFDASLTLQLPSHTDKVDLLLDDIEAEITRLRSQNATMREALKIANMRAVLVADNELATAQDALETIRATLRHRLQPQDVTFHRGLAALRDARYVLGKSRATIASTEAGKETK